MEVLQIGSLAILLKWVLLGAAILIGLIFIRVWFMRKQEVKRGKQIFDLLVNSLFIGFFTWKGSLLLLEPGLIVKSPLSLLYFTGGRDGLVIAIACALIYYFVKVGKTEIKKQLYVQTIFIFSSMVLGLYHLFLAIFLPEDTIFHILIGIVALLAVLYSNFVFFILLGKGESGEREGGDKMNKKSILVLIGLFGLIGWAIYDNYFSKPSTNGIQQVEKATVVDGEMGLENGNKAPNFQLETLSGEAIRLSDLEGKKVILNFWATWCPPCKAEMPHMQDFYEEQKDKNVELLSVNLTTAEKNVKDIEMFINDYELTFPIVLDRDGDIRDLYQAISIPTTYFIDSEGFIRKKVIGPMDKEMMYELVRSMN